MISKFFLVCILCFSLAPFHLDAQNKLTISGHIRDAANGEDLIGATVLVTENRQGAVTNVYGFYSVTLAQGTYHLE